MYTIEVDYKKDKAILPEGKHEFTAWTEYEAIKVILKSLGVAVISMGEVQERMVGE